MRDICITIGGLEKSYMQRLALHLKDMLPQTDINICESASSLKDEAAGHRVLIGSEAFIKCAGKGAGGHIILTDEEDERPECIMRYQPAQRVCRQIAARLKEAEPGSGLGRNAALKLILFTTDGPVCDMTAFSLLCALVLSEAGGAVHINLSACSGEQAMTGADAPCDLSDLILRLRKDEAASPSDLAFRMEKADCILPPANPMVLREMDRSDALRLLWSLKNAAGCRWAVAAAGCAFDGLDEFIAAADMVIHITAAGAAQSFASDEWIKFIGQCRPGTSSKARLISLPGFEPPLSGISPIYEWMKGEMGRLAAECVKDLLTDDKD